MRRVLVALVFIALLLFAVFFGVLLTPSAETWMQTFIASLPIIFTMIVVFLIAFSFGGGDIFVFLSLPRKKAYVKVVKVIRDGNQDLFTLSGSHTFVTFEFQDGAKKEFFTWETGYKEGDTGILIYKEKRKVENEDGLELIRFEVKDDSI